MTSLRMLCSITLTFILNVKHFLVMYLHYKLCDDSGYLRKICLDSRDDRRGDALVVEVVVIGRDSELS